MALIPVFPGLGLTYSEDFGSAARAFTLGCGATILHRYYPRILNINLFPALHTIRLHLVYLLFDMCAMDDKLFLVRMSIVEGIVEIEVTKA